MQPLVCLTDVHLFSTFRTALAAVPLYLRLLIGLWCPREQGFMPKETAGRQHLSTWRGTVMVSDTQVTAQ